MFRKGAQLGPITLFDKSFLQSLKLDEAVWYDTLFLSNVCPLFYVETLADLEKPNKKAKSAAEQVRIIADKFPQMNSGPCAYHRDLYIGSLLGQDVPMTGQIPLDRGKLVMHEGQLYGVAKESAVAAAFMRWQEGKFFELEHLFARTWRNNLSNLNLEQIATLFRTLGINPKSCKSLENAKSIAQNVVTDTTYPESRIGLAFSVTSIPVEAQAQISSRWQSQGRPPLNEFAPYSAFVLEVELFFNIALAAGLIATERHSNRIDIAYLFYLPFCMIFVSSDHLHSETAPLFLRDEQEFVWGHDLKSALSEINRHYSALPDSEKEKPVYEIAPTPPKSVGALVEQLWDRHLPGWRESKISPEQTERKTPKEMLETVREIERASPIRPDSSFRHRDVEAVTIRSRVRRKRGSWYQVPKDIQGVE
jgi:hypothetical protein